MNGEMSDQLTEQGFLFATGPLSEPDLSKQWRLARVEVVNWGTFDGFHGVNISRKGHLFTGPSGSGKSSLLDAITAALTPKRAITFNAAAQESGGRKADRTWITYVRGAWAKEADALEDKTVATYLRKTATWSGIMLRFQREDDDPVSLYRLFHLRGSSSSSTDLKELSFITRTDQPLLDFAPYADNGIDLKRLKSEQNPVIAAPGAKPGPYFNRLRRLLGIRNETALQLLHRTQAAKNFGTLDTLFRKFMLDEPRTFRMAETSVEEFGELRDAHSHVVDLGHQRDALLLVEAASKEYEDAQKSSAHFDNLSKSVVPFANALKLDLATKALSHTNGEVTKAETKLVQVEEKLVHAQNSLKIAERQVLELDGGDQMNLRDRIVDAKRDCNHTVGRRRSLATRVENAEIPMPSTETEYAELLIVAEQTLGAPHPANLDYDLQARTSKARTRVKELEKEIQVLNRHKSNIDSRLLEVRSSLSQELNIPVGLMPFAGELISVRSHYADWSGAIERALAPISTALLVRDCELDTVRNLVNARHLGVNLTIDAVPPTSPTPPLLKDQRSLFYRVEIADGVFQDYLNHRLCKDFNFSCVDSAHDLNNVERGLTIQGLIKRSKRRYVKPDSHDVNEKSRWVLGSDVEPKRKILETELTEAQNEFNKFNEELTIAQRNRDKELERRYVLKELLQKPWSEIDVAAATQKVDDLEKQLADMVAPDSELGHATQREKDASDRVATLREDENSVRTHLALAQNKRDELESDIFELKGEPVKHLTDATRTSLNELFRKQRRVIKYKDVHEVASRVQQRLASHLASAQQQVQHASAHFSQNAATFSHRWHSVVTNAELTTQIGDRGGYLDLLQNILTRGLPEHEENFRKLLNERSRDSIAFLRDELLGAPHKIAQRIEPVNASLSTSLYDENVYLHIKTKMRRSEEVRTFLSELKDIVDGSWEEEEFELAEARFQKLASIMDKLASSERSDRDWRMRVLDTREHVTFIAEEVNQDGETQNVHDSSVGLSGGQRQKLVVFCLAAALRYQLADLDNEFPDYGTVILDEAFDKADARYTRVAMDVFQTFGFHMVLATPEKLLQTLEPYLGGITVVTNPEKRFSRLANVEYSPETLEPSSEQTQ